MIACLLILPALHVALIGALGGLVGQTLDVALQGAPLGAFAGSIVP